MENNRTGFLIAAVALVVGIAIGLAAGYRWGHNEGKDINTIQVGPDFKLQWKNQLK